MATIKDCENQQIKVGKTSITIKNQETGKTKGLVRNIIKTENMPFRTTFEYHKILKGSGAFGSKVYKNILLHDGKLYALRNLNAIEFYKKYGFFSDDERESYNKVEQIYRNLENMGVSVINCYLV